MKHLRNALRGIVAASILSLALVRPMIAQQEVSPDHFDSAGVQDTQTTKVSAKAHGSKAVRQTAAKKQTTKVQHARNQNGSSKKVSS